MNKKTAEIMREFANWWWASIDSLLPIVIVFILIAFLVSIVEWFLEITFC